MPKVVGILFWCIAGPLFGWGLVAIMGETVEHFTPTGQYCTFDRNEIGPKGDHGQWYWEFYKCADGTKRRIMVAGPRG